MRTDGSRSAGPDRRAALVRLGWAAAFFAIVLAAFVVLFAVGLFH